MIIDVDEYKKQSLVFIDESGDAGFKFEKGSSLYFADSKSNVLIQLADMLAGSERRFFEFKEIKTDAKIYRDIVKKKIQDEWEFK